MTANKHLYETMCVEFRTVRFIETPDGAGGVRRQEVRGESFSGFLSEPSRFARSGRESAAMRSRDSLPEGRLVLLADGRGAEISRMSLVRRVSDGALYRIVSEPVRSPGCASFALIRAEAEPAALMGTEFGTEDDSGADAEAGAEDDSGADLKAGADAEAGADAAMLFSARAEHTGREGSA